MTMALTKDEKARLMRELAREGIWPDPIERAAAAKTAEDEMRLAITQVQEHDSDNPMAWHRVHYRVQEAIQRGHSRTALIGVIALLQSPGGRHRVDECAIGADGAVLHGLLVAVHAWVDAGKAAKDTGHELHDTLQLLPTSLPASRPWQLSPALLAGVLTMDVSSVVCPGPNFPLLHTHDFDERRRQRNE